MEKIIDSRLFKSEDSEETHPKLQTLSLVN